MIATRKKEELSLAYLTAVAAVGGVAVEPHRHDDDSVDVTIKKRLPGRSGQSWNVSVNVQLKSTATDVKTAGGALHYPLKAKNYNDLRAGGNVRHLLMLLVLPPEEEKWAACTAEELVIRKCMYWADPATWPPTGNQESVTVAIPEDNLVTPDALEKLLTETQKMTEGA